MSFGSIARIHIFLNFTRIFIVEIKQFKVEIVELLMDNFMVVVVDIFVVFFIKNSVDLPACINHPFLYCFATLLIIFSGHLQLR